MLKKQSGLRQPQLQSEDRVEATEGRVEPVVASAQKDPCEANQAHGQACRVQDEGDAVLADPRLPCACLQ